MAQRESTLISIAVHVENPPAGEKFTAMLQKGSCIDGTAHLTRNTRPFGNPYLCSPDGLCTDADILAAATRCAGANCTALFATVTLRAPFNTSGTLLI
jgi:hypothetical protein